MLAAGADKLVIFEKIVMTLIFFTVSLVKAKMFYDFRCGRKLGIALLTLWSMLPDLLIEAEDFVSPHIDIYNYMVFFAVNLSVYMLTPPVLALLVKDWLRVSSDVYLYKMVFCSLPAPLALLLIMRDYILEGAEPRDLLMETLVFAIVYAVLSALSILACKKRWLGKIPAALSVAVYIIGFYCVKLGTGLYNIYYFAMGESNDELPAVENGMQLRMFMSLVSVIFAMFVVMIFAIVLMVGRGRKAERLRMRNGVNERLSAYLKTGTESMRRFRHDLANHLQAAQEAERYDIEDYSRSLREFARGFISPEVTGCKELDVFIGQVSSILAEHDKELIVEASGSLADIGQDEAVRAEHEILERLCVEYLDRGASSVTLTLGPDGRVARFVSRDLSRERAAGILRKYSAGSANQ